MSRGQLVPCRDSQIVVLRQPGIRVGVHLTLIDCTYRVAVFASSNSDSTVVRATAAPGSTSRSMLANMEVGISTRNTDTLVYFELRSISEVRIESEPIVVELVDHTSVESAWRASFPVTRNDDGVWRGSLDLEPFTPQPRLFEVARAYVNKPNPDDPEFPVQEPVAVDPNPSLHLEPASPGVWMTAAEAHSALQTRIEERAAFATSTLVAPGSTAGLLFSCVMVLNGVHLTEAQTVRGIQLLPLRESTIGQDAEVVLNAVLPQLGHHIAVPQGAWLKHQSDRHAAVVHIRNIEADNPEGAAALASRAVNELLDLIALRRGARAVPLAGVILSVRGESTLIRPMRTTAGYSGNLVGGFAAGEDAQSLRDLWDAAQQDGRGRLWLSMRADAIKDDRADYRFFGMFNLLEAIAHELLPRTHPVVDDAGQPILMSSTKNGPTYYSMSQARGAVWALAQHVARRTNGSTANWSVGGSIPDLTNPSSRLHVPGDLWSDLKVWVDIRNMVAHEGTVRRPAGTPATGKHATIESELALRSDPPGDAGTGFWLLRMNIESLTGVTLTGYLRGLL